MAKKSIPKLRRKGKAKPRRPSTAIEIRIDRRVHKFGPGEISDPATLGLRINQLFAAAESDPEVRIHDLLSIPDDARFPLFASLLATGRPFKLACGDKTAALRDKPLDAVLDALDGQKDLVNCERLVQAATEVAALFDANHPLAAQQEIANRGRKAGLKSLLPQKVGKNINSFVGATKPAETATAMAIELVAHHRVRTVEKINAVPGDQPPLLAYYDRAFWVFEGTAWRRCSIDEMELDVTQFLQQRPSDREVDSRLIKDVVANLRGLTRLRTSRYGLPLWIGDDQSQAPGSSPYVAFANGLINIEQALTHSEPPELLGHSARHFSPAVLPYDFDPQAQCPLWDQTLEEILPRVTHVRGQTPDRRVQVLQEFMGYTLISGLKYHKCLVLVGHGANGKGVITETWAELLGRENVSHVSIDQFGDRFTNAEMEGKLANMAAEMNYLPKVNEGIFKALVTGDPLQAERKGQQSFVMRPTAKLIFSTNELTPFRDGSDGVRRRLLVMPLRQQFQGRRCDPDRAERLKAELPAIVNWALEGARRLQQQGRFTECGVCAAALAEHRFESDVVAQYFAQSSLGPDGSATQVPTDEFYRGFVGWCDANGYRPLGNREFGKRLHRLGVGRSRQRGNSPIIGGSQYMYLRPVAAVTNAAGTGGPQRPQALRI